MFIKLLAIVLLVAVLATVSDAFFYGGYYGLYSSLLYSSLLYGGYGLYGGFGYGYPLYGGFYGR
jgi:hypothetical protein